MKYFKTGASLAVIAAMGCASAQAQETQNQQPQAEEQDQQRGVQEIVVTATKRSADLQDVPVAVQALGEETLDQLNVTVFDDYLQQLPGVTAGGGGPGQSTIYIRGLASTTPNLTTAGVAGLAPNVALYLDEQPVSQPGRNLDVYAADLERVEVLSGPQGTLFGASSQAGTVRLITNKPVLGEFQAKVKAGVAFTKSGTISNNFEATLNVPIGDRFAVRAVGYYDNQGGYIDNVAGTRSTIESARFRPEGTVRENGVPVNAARAGLQAGADLSNVNFLLADNSNLIEENFNDTQYLGFRISGKYEFSDSWNLTVAHARQGLDSDGVFFTDPSLGDLEIQRFEEDEIEDDFSNTSWTLEGRIGALEIVYTGAYTERETSQRVDYSDYLFVGQYLPYYICDGSVSYPGAGGPSGTCQAPNLFVNSLTETEVQTHELRFSTPDDYWVKVTAGAFYSDLELTERNDFTYPGSTAIDLFGGSFPPNFAQPNAFATDRTAFPAGVIFRNDVRRTDEQFGIFGEATFDVSDQFAITLGARYFDVEVDLEGSANSSFCNSSGVDENAFGTNISDLFDGDGSFTFIGSCTDALRQTFTAGQSIADIEAAGLSNAQAQQVFNSLAAPDTASTDGFIFKINATWTPTDDLLFYATYSEGFRPGLLNRPGGATSPTGFVVPFALDTDDVQNYEIGWKTSLFDNQVRFNGNAFFVDIQRLQTTIFDTSITNLFFSDNAADAEIFGVEGDITIAPYAVDGLTVSAGFSFLDTEVTEVLTPTGDVLVGSTLAFAPSFQGNIRARYEWNVFGDWTGHVQPQLTHSASVATDIIQINRLTLDSWTTVGFAAGITNDSWSLELFGENLFDERAQISANFVNDRSRITVNRPLTVGLRASFRY
ncbi:TonB-dependent receptor [Parasphingorhabdus sp. DH2-15]|uniref:TonB-dependent receptor n=1 Tax=Parasphingorhabdus sp. DH2-15 TaxID=3444112 RepID=UPI003F685AAD